jgi:hypothetical protein
MEIRVLIYLSSLESHYEYYFPGLKMENYDQIRNCNTAQVKGNVLTITDELLVDLTDSKVSDSVSSWILERCAG